MNYFSTDTIVNEMSLSRDRHKSALDGVCAMELVSVLSGEPFSDHPRTVCPVIGSYVRTLNDNVPDDIRQVLLPLLPRLINTVDHSSETRRRKLFALASVNLFAADALRANHFRHYAAYLRRLDFAAFPFEGMSRITRSVLELEVRTEPHGSLGLAGVSVHQARRALLAAFDSDREALGLVPESDCGQWAGFCATNAYASGASNAWNQAILILELAIDTK